MIGAEHGRSKFLQRVDLAGAHLRIVKLNTVAQEQLVELFNLCAGAEQTLVTPEVLKIVATDPFASLLMQVSESRLEAVPVRQVALQLLTSNQSVAEELELVFFDLEEVLEDLGPLIR